MRCEDYSSKYIKCVSGPSTVLVHCSAGVGRSGTFIALYKLMTKIDVGEISHTIDILNEVFTLREDRCHMVKYFSQNLLKRDSLNLSKDFFLTDYKKFLKSYQEIFKNNLELFKQVKTPSLEFSTFAISVNKILVSF
jgi:hypothetical protein